MTRLSLQISRTLVKLNNQLKRNKRFDNFIVLVCVDARITISYCCRVTSCTRKPGGHKIQGSNSKVEQWTTDSNKLLFANYRNKLTNLTRVSKKNYYCNLLDANKNNLRQTWKVLNGLLGRDRTNLFPIVLTLIALLQLILNLLLMVLMTFLKINIGLIVQWYS